MKEQFITTALDMLQEGTPVRNMNLRQIARRIGCAHTNAYNYFSSYEELLWHALVRAQKLMIEEAYITERTTEYPDLICAYVDFALSHPSWYRLIWTEPLSGSPPEGLLEQMRRPSRIFNAWIEQISGRTEDNIRIASMLHSYLHGELIKIVSRRVLVPESDVRTHIIERAQYMLQMLIQNR